MLVHDRDDTVVKALSWVLRELSKRDPKAVEQFVRQHKNALAARVIREVGNKLRTGVKNPRRART
jgi:3-methyladenine DNA glycosylase AlkD